MALISKVLLDDGNRNPQGIFKILSKLCPLTIDWASLFYTFI